MGNHANPQGRVVALQGHFIVKLKGPGLVGFHSTLRKIQNHRFFDPFVDNPALCMGLGDPQCSAVEGFNYLRHGMVCFRALQFVAVGPYAFYGLAQVVPVRIHRFWLKKFSSIRLAAAASSWPLSFLTTLDRPKRAAPWAASLEVRRSSTRCTMALGQIAARIFATESRAAAPCEMPPSSLWGLPSAIP